MKHIIKTRSLYEYYKKYPEAYINLVLQNYFDGAKTSINLLKKHFGPKFDGKNIDFTFLNYYEQELLDGILSRFDDMLAFVDTLINVHGKTLDDVKKIFKTKSDVELHNYAKNVLAPLEKQTKITSLKEFKTQNNLNDKEIMNILEFHSVQNERLAFKYKYGIGLKKLEDQEIIELLKIDKTKLNNYINNVLINLPNLLKQYQNANIKVNKPVAIYKKPVIKNDKPIDLSVKPIPIIKKIQNSKTNIKNKRLIDYIIENVKEDEIASYQKKLDQIVLLEENQNSKQFQILKEISHNNLLTIIDLRKYSSREKQNFYNLLPKLKNYLSLNEEDFIKKIQNFKTTNKKRLIDYIIENVKDEDITIYQKKFDQIVLLEESKNSKQFQILKEVSHNNLLTIIDLRKYSQNDKQNFYYVISKLKKYLSLTEEDLMEKLQSSKINNIKNKRLIDYIIEDVKEDEIVFYQEKLDQIVKLEENQNSKQFQILKEVSHNNLLAIIDLNKFPQNEKYNFYHVINKLKKYLSLSLEEINLKNRRLIDYIIEGVKEENIAIYQKKLDQIVLLEESKNSKQFQVLKEIANNNLLTIIDLNKYTRNEKRNFYYVISKLKKYLSLTEEDFMKKFQSSKTNNIKNKRNKRLIDYIVKDIKEEDIISYQEKFDQIVKLEENKNSKNFQALKEIANNNLLAIIDLRKFSKNEKQNFYYAISKLKTYLNLTEEDFIKKIQNFKTTNKIRLIDYIIENVKEEDIAIYQEKLDQIVKLEGNQNSKQFQILKEVSNNNLLAIIDLKKFSQNEKQNFYYAISKLKIYFQKELSKIQVNKNLDLENYKKLLYIDLIIYKLFNDQKSPEFIAKFLNVSLSTVFSSIIKNITSYNILEVINCFGNKYPEYLHLLLLSDYFSFYMQDMTPVEKNLIYYKLLGYFNKDITSTYIASLLDLPIDVVEDYQIMTKYDELNDLNKYLTLKK